jgi:hypothetical protein
MAEKNVDDELVNWNTILDGIIGGSEVLLKDLLEGVRYVGASGVLLILIGVTVLIYNSRLWGSDTGLVVASVLTSIIPMAVGLFTVNKYIQLRSRYSKLFDLHIKLKK